MSSNIIKRIFKREKAAESDAVSIADTATLVEPASTSSQPQEADPRNLTGGVDLYNPNAVNAKQEAKQKGHHFRKIGENYTNSMVYAEVNNLTVTDNTYYV
ncbi:hypothetical protein EV183_004485 [Coemansia sp. RSA 2336]|nr:hypothetical protein EV183_004485 [Coemansia sp. RSA 2336]